MEKLDFTPTKNPDGSISWSLCIQGGKCSTAPGDFPAVDVGKGNADVKFVVNITNDQTGMGIKFAPTNPLWVQQGTKPTAPVLDSQIYGLSGANSTTLNFTDANCNKGDVTLKYVLNFVDNQGKSVNPVDPDIKNGGTQLNVANTWQDKLAQVGSTEWLVLATIVIAAFLIGRYVFPRRV